MTGVRARVLRARAYEVGPNGKIIMGLQGLI